MSRQPSICLIVLVVGALIAGCGSSSKSATTAGSSTAPASSGHTGVTGAKAVHEAVRICRKLVVLGTPTLSTGEKTRLEGMCSQASSATLPEAQKTVTEVCETVINSTPLTRHAKEIDLAACKAKVK
jgi:hypothetical protein